jgi:hypothetical protein
MSSRIDFKFKLDIYITFVATIISVFFILYSYIFPNYASQILSILVIVLPTIYIVGNLVIRGIMERELIDLRIKSQEALFEAEEGIEEMKLEIERLKKIF